jgi:GNAT superfamily N-acetyltransferase
MPEILQDLTEKALTRAIVENMYDMTPLNHFWPEMESYQGKDVAWCITDMAFPTCNAMMRVNMTADAANELIGRLVGKAKKKKINLHCWITRDTRPVNLAEYLTAHGFTSQGKGAGMAIYLKELNEEKNTPAGFKIVEVKDKETLKIWCRIAGTAFSIPEPAISSIYEWFAREIELKQPLKFYLGLLNGKPVATSNYYLGAGVCGIYFVGTLPEARNKGIGFSITQKPLLEAKKLGYKAGILQASSMGYPVYLKLGFREYSKIGSYSWIYELQKGVKK